MHTVIHMMLLPSPWHHLGQQEVVVQLVDALHVGEHLRYDLRREHVVCPVLVVHAELELLREHGREM